MAEAVGAEIIPELIKAAKDGHTPLDVIENYHDDTVAVYENFEGALDFKDRHRSLELLLVNATHKNIVFEEEYFDSGTWFVSPLPLTIEPGRSSLMYVANKQASFLTGVCGGLRYKIQGTKRYIYIGFSNPQIGSYKNFVSVSLDIHGAEYGYENAEDDTVKDYVGEGYHAQCTMHPPRQSSFKMFQYIIYES